MKIHNVRSPEQWEIISRYVDFRGKTVLDLGCGKGDILVKTCEAGAAMVLGVDMDKEALGQIKSNNPRINVLHDDIPSLSELGRYDIIICFSVLPYMPRPSFTLQWVNDHSEIALIECQYYGDGPGFWFLRGNDAMERWLLESGKFKKVNPIGSTLVEGRNKKRFIWMCE